MRAIVISMEEALKVCNMCKEPKVLSAFGRSGRDGHQSRCKVCINAYWQQPKHKQQKRDWAKRNWHKVRHGGLMRRFQMPLSEYEDRMARQRRKCACCGEVRPVLEVDHNHKCCPGKRTCGKCTRDLLCKGCNKALGFLGDNPKVMKRALAYLRKWERLAVDRQTIEK